MLVFRECTSEKPRDSKRSDGVVPFVCTRFLKQTGNDHPSWWLSLNPIGKICASQIESFLRGSG